MTRLLVVSHTAKLGGGEIALANLLTHLHQADDDRFKPEVVVFEDGPLVDRLGSVGIPTTLMPLGEQIRAASKDATGIRSIGKLPAAMKFVGRLKRHIRQSGAELVYCNSLKADVLGGVAARLAGVPCIWHVRDRVEPDYLPAKVVPVFRKLAAWVPAGVAANSEHTLATLHLPREKPTQVIYSGVVPPAEVADEPDGPPVIGLVGRLAPWKGQHVFLEAAARVRADIPDARFRLIGSALFGEDDYERRLRDRAERPDLSGAVEFSGFRDDIWSALAELNLVVHASVTPEPFGQVVVEAMAARRAVIATDGGGVRETVVDGQTGVLIAMGDEDRMAESMARQIVRLLRDDDLRHRMAAAGRDRALSTFHISQTSQTCLTLIDEVLSRRARR
ncbi:MAG: glycosyltransferase family 4 protein [Planctomycetota bacterium]